MFVGPGVVGADCTLEAHLGHSEFSLQFLDCLADRRELDWREWAFVNRIIHDQEHLAVVVNECRFPDDCLIGIFVDKPLTLLIHHNAA